AAAKLTIPTLAIFGDRSVVSGFNFVGAMMCTDPDENVTGVSRALAGPRFGLRIRGASHCAGESPSDFLCESVCGTATPQSQLVYPRYMMAFLDSYITCNHASFPIVDAHAQPIDPSADIFSNDNRGSPSDVCQK